MSCIPFQAKSRLYFRDKHVANFHIGRVEDMGRVTKQGGGGKGRSVSQSSDFSTRPIWRPKYNEPHIMPVSRFQGFYLP